MLGLNHLMSFVDSENFLEWCYIYPLVNSNEHTTTDSTRDHNISLSQVTQVTYRYILLIIDRKLTALSRLNDY